MNISIKGKLVVEQADRDFQNFQINELTAVNKPLREALELIASTDCNCLGACNRCTAVERFAELWDEINGKKHPWATNPWVWVVEFTKL